MLATNRAGGDYRYDGEPGFSRPNAKVECAEYHGNEGEEELASGQSLFAVPPIF